MRISEMSIRNTKWQHDGYIIFTDNCIDNMNDDHGPVVVNLKNISVISEEDICNTDAYSNNTTIIKRLLVDGQSVFDTDGFYNEVHKVMSEMNAYKDIKEVKENLNDGITPLGE